MRAVLERCSAAVRGKSYANAVVLAAFAREALGQWIILLDLRQKVLGGEKTPIRKLKMLYDDRTETNGGYVKLHHDS